MSNPNLDYDADHYCPVFRKVIDADLCFECIMALGREVKVSSVPELSEIKNIEKARIVCAECPYYEP